MRIIVRNPLHSKRQIYAQYQPETFEFIGEPAPVPAALAGDNLGLTTGDRRFPVRIIAKSDIVSIDGAVQSHDAPASDRITIVQGSKGSVYTVSVGRSGNSCTCPGFRFRGSCRHVAAALVA